MAKGEKKKLCSLQRVEHRIPLVCKVYQREASLEGEKVLTKALPIEEKKVQDWSRTQSEHETHRFN